MIVVAEYDCDPDHRDELGFKEGERIVVTERLNKDWLVRTTCRTLSSLLVECHNQRKSFLPLFYLWRYSIGKKKYQDLSNFIIAMFAFQSGEPGNEASASHTGNIPSLIPSSSSSFPLLVGLHS